MTMKLTNLAIMPAEGSEPIDKDGDDSDGFVTFQLTIDIAKNGFVLSKISDEDTYQKVFLYDGNGENGPKGMIADIIAELGISQKVKLER